MTRLLKAALMAGVATGVSSGASAGDWSWSCMTLQYALSRPQPTPFVLDPEVKAAFDRIDLGRFRKPLPPAPSPRPAASPEEAMVALDSLVAPLLATLDAPIRADPNHPWAPPPEALAKYERIIAGYAERERRLTRPQVIDVAQLRRLALGRVEPR